MYSGLIIDLFAHGYVDSSDPIVDGGNREVIEETRQFHVISLIQILRSKLLSAILTSLSLTGVTSEPSMIP